VTALERPVITLMLHHRYELSLSPQQVRDLEDLRDGYERDAIRHDAEIRIAEVDLQRLLKAATVDLEQVNGKLQEMEHLKTETRLARIRAIEQGKALLSPEQREKLSALLREPQYSHFGRDTEPEGD
jgi:Spy/CpxP family protein refolding chaperone